MIMTNTKVPVEGRGGKIEMGEKKMKKPGRGRQSDN